MEGNTVDVRKFVEGNTVDVRKFAERVERFCDFLLSQVDLDGSPEVVLIQEIKEDAANLQSLKNMITIRDVDKFIQRIFLND